MTATPLILVIEDDSAIRRGLVDALRFAGYRTAECGDGGRAVDCASETAPNLILLDVLLPGRSGFDILADLRRLQPTLPVIMVTAKGAEQDRVRGLSDGADDYIVKPFSPRELLARVEAVLRRSPERGGDVAEVTIDIAAMAASTASVHRPKASHQCRPRRGVMALRSGPAPTRAPDSTACSPSSAPSARVGDRAQHRRPFRAGAQCAYQRCAL